LLDVRVVRFGVSQPTFYLISECVVVRDKTFSLPDFLEQGEHVS
jgi:hypothetical protein